MIYRIRVVLETQNSPKEPWVEVSSIVDREGTGEGSLMWDDVYNKVRDWGILL